MYTTKSFTAVGTTQKYTSKQSSSQQTITFNSNYHDHPSSIKWCPSSPLQHPRRDRHVTHPPQTQGHVSRGEKTRIKQRRGHRSHVHTHHVNATSLMRSPNRFIHIEMFKKKKKEKKKPQMHRYSQNVRCATTLVPGVARLWAPGAVRARFSSSLAAVSQHRCVEWRMGACVRRRAVIPLAGHFEVQGGSNNVMRLR